MTGAAIYAMVHADLEAQPGDRQAQRRYFSLAHLLHQPGVTEEVLRAHRLALPETVQSFTRSGRAVLHAVAKSQDTIFAIDLDQLGWDASHWARLLKGYRYGLDYETAAAVYRKTGCAQPLIRGDWFVLAVHGTALGRELRGGADDPLMGHCAEAVQQVGDWYQRDLTRETMAAELGLATPDELAARQRLTGLDPQRPLPRAEWEAVQGAVSRFQKTARSLGLAGCYSEL